jgi:hypothetical protein
MERALQDLSFDVIYRSVPPTANCPERIKIAKVIKRETGNQHWPAGEEQNIALFERVEVLRVGREGGRA